MVGLFDQADFVSSTIVQYLGVRSLVRFGSTCKFHRDVVSKEVERRRVCIAAIEHDATMRLVTQRSWSSSIVIALDSVTVARRIARDSLRLIDDEIGFHHNFCNKIWNWVDYPGREYDIFRQERKEFLSKPNVGSMFVFNNYFYFPRVGETSMTTEEQIDREYLRLKTFITEVKYEDIFCDDVIHYEGVYDYIWHLAFDIKNNGVLDAFRIACRRFVFQHPASVNFIGAMLQRVDYHIH